MAKENHNTKKSNGKDNQLSLEFSTKPLTPPTPATENSRVISLSQYKPLEKPIVDYSNLVLKNTKSF